MKKIYVLCLVAISVVGIHGMKRKQDSSPDRTSRALEGAEPESPAEARMRARVDESVRLKTESMASRRRRLLFSGLDPTLEEELWAIDAPKKEREDFMNNLTPSQVALLNKFNQNAGQKSIGLTKGEEEIYLRFPQFIRNHLRFILDYNLADSAETSSELNEEEIKALDEEIFGSMPDTAH